jgi:F0F1-type ATP synthase assembly protein I
MPSLLKSQIEDDTSVQCPAFLDIVSNVIVLYTNLNGEKRSETLLAILGGISVALPSVVALTCSTA